MIPLGWRLSGKNVRVIPRPCPHLLPYRAVAPFGAQPGGKTMTHSSSGQGISRRSAILLGLSAPLASHASQPPSASRAKAKAVRDAFLSTVYTARSAPDHAGRVALARRIPSLAHGASSQHAIPAALHRNFPQLIEQGVARMTPTRASAWAGSLSPIEMQMLAQLYDRACNDIGHSKLLPAILASRVDPMNLARLASSLGVDPIYAAVNSIAPQKLPLLTRALDQRTSVERPQPVFGVATGPTTDMTLYEIYQSFRGGPTGGLGFSSAVYAASVYASKHLTVVWGVSYVAGTLLGSFIQNYFPATYDWIGESLYNFVESIHGAPGPSELGDALYHGASLFRVEEPAYSQYAYLGGDHGVTAEWAYNTGGAGDGGDGCSFLIQCNPW